MRKTEVPHYTPEQVRFHLVDALTAVNKANVPPELREAAYREAVRLLAAKQIVVEQFTPPMLTPSGTRP